MVINNNPGEFGVSNFKTNPCSFSICSVSDQEGRTYLLSAAQL